MIAVLMLPSWSFQATSTDQVVADQGAMYADDPGRDGGQPFRGIVGEVDPGGRDVEACGNLGGLDKVRTAAAMAFVPSAPPPESRP